MANALCVSPRGFKNSSSNISPGCVGGRFLGKRRETPWLVIVCDFDFEGMAFLPLETDPELLVDPDAVLTCPIPAKALKAIAGRDR
jgi:hypothetical protein